MMNKKKIFASRTEWPLSVNSLSSLLGELKGHKAPLIDLTESNPTRCDFKFPSEQFLKILSGSSGLHYDPGPRGSFKAREAISGYYQKKHFRVAPDQIFLTSSTSEAYSFLFRLLVDVDQRVLFPRPSYPLFQYFVDLNDIQVEYYPLILERGAWRINFQQFKDEKFTNSRAIVLVNPNNPTGSFIQKKEFPFLNEFCGRNQIPIISDEVFSDFCFDEQFQSSSLVENREVLTFTLGGLSKTLALPQMKLSWIIVSGPQKTTQEACDRLEVIADTYLSVNTPVQNALPFWLEEKELIQGEIYKRLKDNLDYLREKCSKSQSAEMIEPQGGWYAVLKFKAKMSEEEFVLRLLKEDRVFVHPGYFFDFEDEGYIVLSLLPQAETFQTGVGRILNFLNSGRS